MTTGFTANELVALLDEQQDLLTRLSECGQRQQHAIQANRMSELLAILGEKQPSLLRLEAIRRELHAQRENLQSDSFWPSQEVRCRCQRLRQQSERCFEALIELERNCEVALSESRSQIRDRLQQIDSGRAAAVAYGSQSGTPSRGDFSSIG